MLEWDPIHRCTVEEARAYARVTRRAFRAATSPHIRAMQLQNPEHSPSHAFLGARVLAVRGKRATLGCRLKDRRKRGRSPSWPWLWRWGRDGRDGLRSLSTVVCPGGAVAVAAGTGAVAAWRCIGTRNLHSQRSLLTLQIRPVETLPAPCPQRRSRAPLMSCATQSFCHGKLLHGLSCSIRL
eukprot:3443236-Pleurochrysis_carterae.AAC.1